MVVKTQISCRVFFTPATPQTAAETVGVTLPAFSNATDYSFMKLCFVFCVVISAVVPVSRAFSQAATPSAAQPYSIYIASEAADIITRVNVNASGWRKAGEVSVKLVPNEISGPHSVAVSPDGRYWYVSIAHGTPNGSIWKFNALNDSLMTRVSVGMFPTTVALSPDGAWA